jgi:hypothetical protein
LERAARGRRLPGVVFEQRYNWGRAYRNGELVCARVHLTVGRDGWLGLTRSMGWVQPPEVRRGDRREIEFGLRERAR